MYDRGFLMKKLKWCAALAFFLALSTITFAGPILTIEDPALSQWTAINGGLHPYATLNSVTDVAGPGVEFDISFSSPPSGTWVDFQGGDDFALLAGVYPFTVSSGLGDISGYDSYSLLVSNTSTTNDWFMANVYINTGATDWGETDMYYENTWTWIAPGETKVLTLGLDASTMDNLNHVSNIGFNIGTHYGTGNEDYTADNIKVGVAPVPEASTLMLFGSGLSGLLYFARKKRLIKF